MNRDVVISAVVVGAGVWFMYSNGDPFSHGPTIQDEAEPVTDNTVWSNYAYGNSVRQGYHPELVSRALRKFNTGQYLDGEEFAYMKSATNLFGDPDIQPSSPQNRPFNGLQTNTGPQPVNQSYAYMNGQEEQAR